MSNRRELSSFSSERSPEMCNEFPISSTLTLSLFTPGNSALQTYSLSVSKMSQTGFQRFQSSPEPELLPLILKTVHINMKSIHSKREGVALVNKLRELSLHVVDIARHPGIIPADFHG